MRLHRGLVRLLLAVAIAGLGFLGGRSLLPAVRPRAESTDGGAPGDRPDGQPLAARGRAARAPERTGGDGARNPVVESALMALRAAIDAPYPSDVRAAIRQFAEFVCGASVSAAGLLGIAQRCLEAEEARLGRAIVLAMGLCKRTDIQAALLSALDDSSLPLPLLATAAVALAQEPIGTPDGLRPGRMVLIGDGLLREPLRDPAALATLQRCLLRASGESVDPGRAGRGEFVDTLITVLSFSVGTDAEVARLFLGVISRRGGEAEAALSAARNSPRQAELVAAAFAILRADDAPPSGAIRAAAAYICADGTTKERAELVGVLGDPGIALARRLEVAEGVICPLPLDSADALPWYENLIAAVVAVAVAAPRPTGVAAPGPEAPRPDERLALPAHERVGGVIVNALSAVGGRSVRVRTAATTFLLSYVGSPPPDADRAASLLAACLGVRAAGLADALVGEIEAARLVLDEVACVALVRAICASIDAPAERERLWTVIRRRASSNALSSMDAAIRLCTK